MGNNNLQIQEVQQIPKSTHRYPVVTLLKQLDKEENLGGCKRKTTQHSTKHEINLINSWAPMWTNEETAWVTAELPSEPMKKGGLKCIFKVPK